MCLSLGPPGNRVCSKEWNADTYLRKHSLTVTKVKLQEKEGLEAIQGQTGPPTVLHGAYQWHTCLPRRCVCSARGPSPGKHRKKSSPKCRPKKRSKRRTHLPGSLPSSIPTGWYYYPTLPGCIIWLLYPSFGMLYQCTSSYLEFGFKKSPKKYEIWNVLFPSPMNLVTEPEVSMWQQQNPKCTHKREELSLKHLRMVPLILEHLSLPGCMKIYLLLSANTSSVPAHSHSRLWPETNDRTHIPPVGPADASLQREQEIWLYTCLKRKSSIWDGFPQLLAPYLFHTSPSIIHCKVTNSCFQLISGMFWPLPSFQNSFVKTICDSVGTNSQVLSLKKEICETSGFSTNI